MTCKHCNKKLNESIIIEKNGIKYKSCPRCSSQNGKYHIFKEYLSGFGITDKRITSNNLDGVQSYCNCHRGNKNKICNENTLSCTEFVDI